jgi:hypothetical protein
LNNPVKFVDPLGLFLPAAGVGVAEGLINTVGGALILDAAFGTTTTIDTSNLPDAANDPSYGDNGLECTDSDDDCDQLLKDLDLLFKYVALQIAKNGRSNSAALINAYNKAAAKACKVCPRICKDLLRFD